MKKVIILIADKEEKNRRILKNMFGKEYVKKFLFSLNIEIETESIIEAITEDEMLEKVFEVKPDFCFINLRLLRLEEIDINLNKTIKILRECFPEMVLIALNSLSTSSEFANEIIPTKFNVDFSLEIPFSERVFHKLLVLSLMKVA